MQVNIAASADDGSLALTSLFRWLSRDPDVRRLVAVSMASGTSEGSMGSFDVICAVLTQAAGLGTLAVAIASWRDSRAGKVAIKVSAGSRSVSLEGDSGEIALAIAGLLGSVDAAAVEENVAGSASTSATGDAHETA